ncbi:hypothetical protein OH77DRAFT_997079 [Trametes cingulata]|nr:hypothetical protein OH77DRAFT_997079 [Trametes cingulata]
MMLMGCGCICVTIHEPSGTLPFGTLPQRQCSPISIWRTRAARDNSDVDHIGDPATWRIERPRTLPCPVHQAGTPDAAKARQGPSSAARGSRKQLRKGGWRVYPIQARTRPNHFHWMAIAARRLNIAQHTK